MIDGKFDDWTDFPSMAMYPVQLQQFSKIAMSSDEGARRARSLATATRAADHGLSGEPTRRRSVARALVTTGPRQSS